MGTGTGVGASVGAVSASTGSPSNQGSIASMLGALNAAHASKTALAHANSHSRVGKIAAYSKAVSTAEASLDAAQAAFAMNPTPANEAAVIAARNTLTRTEFSFARRAANKSVTPTVISALNGLLGIR